MRRDTAAGVLKRLAVAQADESKELVKLSVAVDGKRAAPEVAKRECFLRDDRRENDAHTTRLIQRLPIRAVQKSCGIRKLAFMSASKLHANDDSDLLDAY